MKFRLRATPRTRCTTLDHVYEAHVRGSYCSCGAHRWGYENTKRNLQLLDARGRVYRVVWRVIKSQAPNDEHDYWVYVCTVHGCGHIITKRTESKAVWTGIKIRCRMCERTYTELEAETARVRAQSDKRREKEMQAIRHMMARKRLVIRVPKKSKRIVVTVSKAARGRGDT